MSTRTKSPLPVITALAVLLALSVTGVFAENIVTSNQYAYSEREGWINFRPGAGPGITVTSTNVTGYAWGERIGWVSVSCHNDEPGTPCASRGNWEVTNDGAGHLSGYAWTEREGWISFSCKNDEPAIPCASQGNWGVNIGTSTGVFSGQAWGEHTGWITFACPGSPGCGSVAYQVQTDWRGCAGDCDVDAGYPAVLGDGCADIKEPLLVPATSPTNPWDFFSAPVPALFAAPNPLVVFRDGTVSAADAQAIFAYFKKGAKTGTLEYEQDLNANGIKDGVEYDRTVVGPGQSGPPNGVVAAQDAQLAFAQFKLGYHC